MVEGTIHVGKIDENLNVMFSSSTGAGGTIAAHAVSSMERAVNFVRNTLGCTLTPEDEKRLRSWQVISVQISQQKYAEYLG